MKKKITACLLVALCFWACLACGDSAIAGTYRSVDNATNTRYFIELYSNSKCKVYWLGEGEITSTLMEGTNLYYGKYKYTLDEADSDGKRTGTITLTVEYERAGQKITESIPGKILKSGNISIEINSATPRSFKKQ